VSFLPPVLHCVKRTFDYLQNKGTSLWNFVLNSGLRKLRQGISIVETCYQLSSKKGGRSQRDKLGRCRSTKSIIPPELRRSTTIFYHTDHQALSTARFCRTGQLATADTCRTSSLCTVAWQLARFQLVRRIARSLGDN